MINLKTQIEEIVRDTSRYQYNRATQDCDFNEEEVLNVVNGILSAFQDYVEGKRLISTDVAIIGRNELIDEIKEENK